MPPIRAVRFSSFDGLSWFEAEVKPRPSETFFQVIHPSGTKTAVIDYECLQGAASITDSNGNASTVTIQNWTNWGIDFSEQFSWKRGYNARQVGTPDRGLPFDKAVNTILLCEVYIRNNIVDEHRRQQLLDRIYTEMYIQASHSYIADFDDKALNQLRRRDADLDDLRSYTGQTSNRVFEQMASGQCTTTASLCRLTRAYLREQFKQVSVGDVCHNYSKSRKFRYCCDEQLPTEAEEGVLKFVDAYVSRSLAA